MSGRSAIALDRFIGARICEARCAAGMTQKDLGKAIGVRAKMISRYEAGTSRVAASALAQIALRVDRPVGGVLAPPSEAGEAA